MNRRLHTEERGNPASARTLVFVPGLGGTTRYWASRLGFLEERYRIVLIDVLGFGESPRPWLRYSVARHIEALADALAAYGPATIVGHSLGALLAIAYAAHYPHRTDGLVLIGMPCFASQRDAYAYYRHGPIRAGFLVTNVLLTAVTCIVTRRLLGRLLPYLIRHVPREVAEDLVKHNWRSSTSSLWEVVYRYDAMHDLEHLSASTAVLFIHGSRDVMAPVAAIEHAAARHSRWRLKVFPESDHHPFLREPESCQRLIDGLASRDQGAGIRVAAARADDAPRDPDQGDRVR
ncbi:MAG: alpha/beta hydrolase [Pseudomonadales bacterium]